MKKKKKNDIISVSMDFPIGVINSMIQFLFTDSAYITRKSLLNMRRLFDILDNRQYENNEEIFARIYFIKKVLYCRLVLGLLEPKLILEYAKGGIHDDEIINSIIPEVENGYDLMSEEIHFINNLISERLKYAYLFSYKDDIVRQFEKIEVGDYENLNDINTEIRNLVQKLILHMRKAEVDNENSIYLDLTSENFKNVITDTTLRLKQPTNYFKTGIQYFNQMLNGGFEAGRTYLFLGISGGFKSGMLLSIATWLKSYNNHIKSKDSNKTPCILYITQENSMDETIERLYNISVSGEDIRNYSPEEVIDQLVNIGGLAINESNNLNLRIMYRPNKSINTEDLYSIIEEVEEDGQEVICLIHDYVKRIRPVNPTGELRLDLANIIDEFTVLAKTKHIPVITASQLNRDAMRIIEEAVKSGKTDIAKRLGSSNVGESWGMIENTDWAAIINREYKESNDTTYLSIKQIKTRAKFPKINYFSHPFEKDNGMKLVEDEFLKEPVSILNITDSIGTIINKPPERNAIKGKITKPITTKKPKRTKMDTMDDFDS